MSAAQHTPGPWVVQRYVGSDAFQVHAWGLASNGYQPKRLPVAWIPNGWYRGDAALHHELEANARLIAAAPELFDALRPFVTHNSSDETITITVRTADVTRARAALAKAQEAAS